MPSLCPRPCSRLVTAAVFISVGVVQFIGGIILLKSKYVYLLAGPDFWTSGCNIAVGCLLGLAASVWKQSAKKQSPKHIQRRNLLNALLFSALAVNGATFGILLLGEGNTLLSIQLENAGGQSKSTFRSEVLAYAYAASVCSPIVVMVVCIVSITGNCCRLDTQDFRTPRGSLEKQRSLSLNWVFTPELLSLAKMKARELLSSSSDEEERSDWSDSLEAKDYSEEDLQNILRSVAELRHGKLIEDSTILLKKLDQRRKRYHSANRDGSYIGPDPPKVASGRKNVRDPWSQRSLTHKKALKFESAVAQQKNGHASSECDADFQTSNSNERRKSYHEDVFVSRSSEGPEELLAERNKKHMNSGVSKISSSRDRLRAEVVAAIHSGKVLKGKTARKPVALRDDHEEIQLEGGGFYNVIDENSNSRKKTCSSADGENSVEDTVIERSSSMAGEVVPINLNALKAPKPSIKLIPVKSPVVPDQITENGEADAGENRTSIFENENGGSKFGNFSSFKEDSKVGSKENMPECVRKGSAGIKKYDLNRIPTMESISEEPSTGKSSNSLDEAPSTSKDSLSRVKKKSLSTPFLDGSEISATSRDSDNSDHYTPKRRVTTTKVLRRIWSNSEPGNRMNYRDQVVDEDSLIGLTEEELIARQFRNRSLRKVVKNRIQAEIVI